MIVYAVIIMSYAVIVTYGFMARGVTLRQCHCPRASLLFAVRRDVIDRLTEVVVVILVAWFVARAIVSFSFIIYRGVSW